MMIRLNHRLLSCISVIVFLCSNCKDEETKYVYNSEGKIKFKIETQNGLKHGLLHEYFANGDPKSTQRWSSGALDGLFTDYYEGNKVWRTGEYKSNKRFSIWEYYNEDGSLFQTQKYDVLGNIEEVKRFFPDGRRDPRPFPYVYVDSPGSQDTLTANSQHVLHVKIVNVSDPLLLADDLILTNSLVENKLGLTEVTDTIAILKPNANLEYRHEFIPDKEGRDAFLGLVYCKKDEGATLLVQTLGFRYPIVVRNDESVN